MAVVMNAYDQWRLGNFEGGAINMEVPGGNGVKCALVTGIYTPDQNLHAFWSSVVANEVSGTNYTAGGNVLANGIATVDGAGLVTVDFDDPATWLQSASGFSNARRAIIYHDDGIAATSSRLIGYSADFGVDRGNVASSFSITLNIAGLITSAR